MGKTEAGTFGFSPGEDVVLHKGGEVGGKFDTVSFPGDRVGVVDVPVAPVIPHEGRFEMDEAGDEEVVLFGGSNELA
jgi:hypothetical protein